MGKKRGRLEEMTVFRMAEGPPERRVHAKIVWPGPNEVRAGLICQWPMHQILAHRFSEATLICTATLSGSCQHCEQGVARKWIGFVGCYDPGPGRHVLMQITEAAAVSCPALLQLSPSLVNYRLRVKRMGSSKRSRCTAEVLEPLKGSYAPEPIDYGRVLANVFGLLDRNGKCAVWEPGVEDNSHV